MEIRYRFGSTEGFNIRIVDDDIPECPEAFEITVTPVLNAVVQNSVIRVIILESDGGKTHCSHALYYVHALLFVCFFHLSLKHVYYIVLIFMTLCIHM